MNKKEKNNSKTQLSTADRVYFIFKLNTLFKKSKLLPKMGIFAIEFIVVKLIIRL